MTRYLARLATGAVLLGVLALSPQSRAADRHPIEVRVVVVTTFEIGKDHGDIPGEFQNWVERYPLSQTIPFPTGRRDLRYDPKRHVLGIVVGEGKAHAAASIMALGLDPRFDVSKAYWILAGIAGIDPARGSVGSAVWAHYVVDGEFGFEIDGRELPQGWDTGVVPDQRATPYEQPPPALVDDAGVEIYTLNRGLADWAYGLTRNIQLPDTPRLKAARAGYPEYPNAQKPPSVMIGDTLTADRFWIGDLITKWAEKWVSYWSQGKATFVTSAEEDTGYMQSLTFLAHARKIDFDRVMDLRTASDFTGQPSGKTAAQFLASEAKGNLAAYMESLDAAYLVGSPVVDELATHWEQYGEHVPSAEPGP